jgi:endonuclease-3
MKRSDSDETVKRLLALLEQRYGSHRRILGQDKSFDIAQGKQPHNADPFRVLISTLLSQRTRDETTDAVTSRLFTKHKTPEDFIRLPSQEIERLIKKVGFYRVKAKRIKEISAILKRRWNSTVPSSMEALLSLPGVGRKTANCVLAHGFGIPALPVDTHVHRIPNRLGIVRTRTPEETERALMALMSKEYWGWLNKAIIAFGKETCKPIRPLCRECELSVVCVYHRRNHST